VHPEERRAATAANIAAGRLPFPHWVSVHPGSGATGLCNGCCDAIDANDYAFTVDLRDGVRLRFHAECFDVYNRSSSPYRSP
jgi:hypothetical protein